MRSYEKLKDYLDGFFAYDVGATGSGIHDDVARAEIGSQLMAMPVEERNQLLRRIGLDLYGEAPYTQEDLDEWDKWLCERDWKVEA